MRLSSLKKTLHFLGSVIFLLPLHISGEVMSQRTLYTVLSGNSVLTESSDKQSIITRHSCSKSVP